LKGLAGTLKKLQKNLKSGRHTKEKMTLKVEKLEAKMANLKRKCTELNQTKNLVLAVS